MFSPNGTLGKREPRATSAYLGTRGGQESGTKPHVEEARWHCPKTKRVTSQGGLGAVRMERVVAAPQIWGVVLLLYIHFQNTFTCIILFNPPSPGEIDKLGTFISPI